MSVKDKLKALLSKIGLNKNSDFVAENTSNKKEEGKEESKLLRNCKSIFKFIVDIIFPILCFSLVFFLLAIFICIVSNTLVIVPEERMGESLGLIISSVIATIGVVAGFYFNKKQTYKEIVTRERIEWLHRLQNNLSEYLKLTREGNAKDADKVTSLYYKIIFSINHEEDEKALDSIRKYNEYVFGNDSARELRIKKGIFKIKSSKLNKEKIIYYEYINKFDKLRRELESNFTEIFKRVWEKIKGEAD